MSGFAPTKMKRKDLEEVYDEFSEFSLNSPARKIRRLDAELPPIMEEEEPSFSAPFGHKPLTPQMTSTVMPEIGTEMVEAEPFLTMNEERALVLYKPMDNPLFLSPSSFRVRPDLINGLKNQVFWAGSSNPVRIEELDGDDMTNISGNSLAVVSWVGTQDSSESRGMIVEEPMEEEEQGGAAMEVEEEDDKQQTSSSIGGEGPHQWPQHCMTPQILQNPSTPITWSLG